ncbi:MAG: Shedu immune nuclease family protein [Gammaproteobacteria bacterium]
MARWSELYSANTEFSVANGDFSKLEIRDANQESGFHYFFDTSNNRLITDFILDDRQQVALMCQVTLIKKVEGYSPRIRLWKKDKTKTGKHVQEVLIPDTEPTHLIKATVDTEGGHENFWKLINFLQSFNGITLPTNTFHVIEGDADQLASVLHSQDKQTVLEAVRIAVGGSLTEQDITLIADRKRQLKHFEKLLTDSEYFESEKARLGKTTEAVWQNFFEVNQWIFGYGLHLVANEALDNGDLERITSGANIFQGAGKRIDAIMRSKGFISSLLFCEIKTHRTPLLAANRYREPDVYRPSKELSGGVAQVQKTVRKASRNLTAQMHRLYTPEGDPTDVEFSTAKPRQVLVIGSLEEFKVGQSVNPEMVESFELFRASLNDVEIITFDELYQRARFIVQN